jgi:hypothetical protein
MTLRRKFKPDKKFATMTPAEIAQTVVPTSRQDVENALKKNPFSRRKAKTILKIIDDLDVDWEAQSRAAKMIEDQLSSSPLMLQFAQQYGMPPLLISRNSFDITAPQMGATGWRGAVGAFDPLHGYIGINSQLFNNGEARVHGGVTRDMPYIIRHEFAHAIDAAATSSNPSVRRRRDEAMQYMVNELKSVLGSDYSVADLARAMYDRNLPNGLTPQETSLALEVSEYAAMNRFEYIAEVFANLSSPSSEGLRQLREEHFEMLSDFLGIDLDELKSLHARTRGAGVFQ